LVYSYKLVIISSRNENYKIAVGCFGHDSVPLTYDSIMYPVNEIWV